MEPGDQGDFRPWRDWDVGPKDGQYERNASRRRLINQCVEGEEEIVTGMVLVVEDETKLRDLVRSFLEPGPVVPITPN